MTAAGPDPASSMGVPFLRPELPPIEGVAAYYRLSEDAGRYSNFGPCHDLFARRLADHVGPDAHCVLVANCTLGLMVALRALTASGRDEQRFVATPSYTFLATTHAIAWCGFTPVFIDVSPDSWNLNPDPLREAVKRYSGRLAAVLACSTFGVAPSQYERRAWEEICRDAHLPLLVDSAAGWGTRDERRDPLGLQGDAEVFSFHATKAMAIGEGGAVLTRNVEIADSIRRLVNFGLGGARDSVLELGLNAKMSEIQAATGLAALDRFEAVLSARRRIAASVRSSAEQLGFVFQRGCERSAWPAIHTLAPSATVRNRAKRFGEERAIQFRSYFDSPIHRSMLFEDCPRVGELAVTEELATRALSLPIANDLTEEEIEAITKCLRDAVEFDGRDL